MSIVLTIVLITFVVQGLVKFAVGFLVPTGIVADIRVRREWAAQTLW
jgi:hypothetical protein